MLYSGKMIILNKEQEKFKKEFLNPIKFSLYFFKNVPMGWFSGMKLKKLSEKNAVSYVPFKWYYRWQNKNPFRSMYFAVQSMGAELSTASIATLAIKGIKPSIAFIVTGMRSTYFKKATDNSVDAVSDRDLSTVYISTVNIHDDNFNIIMKANFAQPIFKTEEDEFIIRLKEDF